MEPRYEPGKSWLADFSHAWQHYASFFLVPPIITLFVGLLIGTLMGGSPPGVPTPATNPATPIAQAADDVSQSLSLVPSVPAATPVPTATLTPTLAPSPTPAVGEAILTNDLPFYFGEREGPGGPFKESGKISQGRRVSLAKDAGGQHITLSDQGVNYVRVEVPATKVGDTDYPTTGLVWVKADQLTLLTQLTP